MKKLTITCIVVFLIFGVGVSGFARHRSLYWDRIDVEIIILPDGNIDVTETQEYVFNGAWNGGLRKIDISRIDGITNISLAEPGIPYKRGPINKKYHYAVSKKLNSVEIKWRSRLPREAPYSNTHKTFILKYRALGAVRFHRKYDELYWKAIFEERASIVRYARAVVRFPESVKITPANFSVTLYSRAEGAHWEMKPEENAIYFEGRNVQPGQRFEIRIKFPKGICQYEPTLSNTLKYNIFPILPIAVPLLSIIITLGIMIYLYHRFGRDYEFFGNRSYYRSPPGELKPGVAGTLVDEKAGMREIVATLFDLARRGYIEIIEEQPEKLWIFKRREHLLRIKKDWENDDELDSYERYLLDHIFPRKRTPGTYTRVSTLRNKFYRYVDKLKDEFFEETLRRGFFTADPRKVKKKYLKNKKKKKNCILNNGALIKLY